MHIEVGDIVKVVIRGHQYSSYEAWAKDHGLNKFDISKSLENGDEGKVLCIDKHYSRNDIIILGLEVGNNHYMISTDGVELVRKAKKPGFITFKEYLRRLKC